MEARYLNPTDIPRTPDLTDVRYRTTAEVIDPLFFFATKSDIVDAQTLAGK
jgi:hypothetical protein